MPLLTQWPLGLSPGRCAGGREPPAEAWISLLSFHAFLPLSVTGDPSHCPVSRELLSSTFPAMLEGPTSGGAPRRTMYVRGCWAAWARAQGRGWGWGPERRPLREPRWSLPLWGCSVSEAEGRVERGPCAGSGGAAESKAGRPHFRGLDKGMPGRTGVAWNPGPYLGRLLGGGTPTLRPEGDVGLDRSGGYGAGGGSSVYEALAARQGRVRTGGSLVCACRAEHGEVRAPVGPCKPGRSLEFMPRTLGALIGFNQGPDFLRT